VPKGNIKKKVDAFASQWLPKQASDFLLTETEKTQKLNLVYGCSSIYDLFDDLHTVIFLS
jgi:hypothetical protein